MDVLVFSFSKKTNSKRNHKLHVIFRYYINNYLTPRHKIGQMLVPLSGEVSLKSRYAQIMVIGRHYHVPGVTNHVECLPTSAQVFSRQVLHR